VIIKNDELGEDASYHEHASRLVGNSSTTSLIIKMETKRAGPLSTSWTPFSSVKSSLTRPIRRFSQ
jgi:hypothetical protein